MLLTLSEFMLSHCVCDSSRPALYRIKSVSQLVPTDSEQKWGNTCRKQGRTCKLPNNLSASRILSKRLALSPPIVRTEFQKFSLQVLCGLN